MSFLFQPQRVWPKSPIAPTFILAALNPTSSSSFESVYEISNKTSEETKSPQTPPFSTVPPSMPRLQTASSSSSGGVLRSSARNGALSGPAPRSRPMAPLRGVSAVSATPNRVKSRGGRRRSFTVTAKTRMFPVKSSPGRLKKRLSPIKNGSKTELARVLSPPKAEVGVAGSGSGAGPPLAANIRVAVRVRPENQREMDGNHR